MFEHRTERLLPRRRFALRVAQALLVVAGLVALALGIGVLGYHEFASLDWTDSLLNASMILTGMGPVAPMESTSAKVFASVYALFSGVVFLSAVGVFFSPIFHRILHRFHLEDSAEPESGDAEQRSRPAHGVRRNRAE